MIRADEVRARLSDAAERAARELEARVDAALEASAEDGAWPRRVDLPPKCDGAVVRIVLARYRDPQAGGWQVIWNCNRDEDCLLFADPRIPREDAPRVPEDASCAPQDRGEP